MTNVLTPEQAAEINRARRESEALEELSEIGARIALQEPGCLVVVLHSVDGKRRQFTGVSSVGVLADVKSFLAYQARLKPEAPSRFVVSKEPTAVEVTHRLVGDTATSRARRRELTFSPNGELISANDAD